MGTFGYLAFSDKPSEIYEEDHGGVILLANYHNAAIYVVFFFYLQFLNFYFICNCKRA